MAPQVCLRRAAFVSAVVLSVQGMSSPAFATEQLEADLQCLALTVYHEARGEPDLGKFAVAHVVLNRSRDARFPKRICDVVYEDVTTPGGCEFSWACDALIDQPKNDEAWRHSMRVARRVYAGLSIDPTGGAMWYHADYVEPAWANSLGSPQRIGRHRFYRNRSSAARTAPAAGDAQHSHSPADTTLRIAKARSSLPAGTMAFLKQLRVTMILYGPDLHDRTARINDVMYHPGDPIVPGLTLASIGEDMVIVRYRDRLFRFPL